MKLSTRIIAAAAALWLAAFVALAGAAYLREAARAEARLADAVAAAKSHVDAVSAYTATEVGAILGRVGTLLYVPHQKPSFAAQSAFATFAEGAAPDDALAMAQLAYRQVALNPMSAADLAEGVEKTLLERLIAEPALTSTSTDAATDDDARRYVAWPVRVTQAGCLECHGDPSETPASVTRAYPGEGGRGWAVGDTVAAHVVSVSLASAAPGAVLTALTPELAVIALGAALFAVVFALVMTWLIARPVGDMADTATKISLGESGQPEFPEDGDDELSSLGAAFNRMRRSLDNAMRLLEK